jgi:YHS domain-containing protein
VDPEQPARLDSAHRALVNYEVYYFGTDAALQTFVAQPWRFTGRVTDPVSRNRFEPTAESPRRSYGGRLFYLESRETAATFDEDPATWGVPHPMMQASK